MDKKRILSGKKILIVDDEKDVLDSLVALLDTCKIDLASSFEEGKRLLEKNQYDIAVLDIMGVNGFELLRIAKERKIPALMLTAQALSEESLKKSAQDGASYFAPKDKLSKIESFVADVIQAREKNENPWVKWFLRLGSFYDKRFSGPGWREKEREFWKEKLRNYPHS